MRDSEEEGFITKTNMERINNGIFAFTMTLLVRNIVIPPLDSTDADLFISTLVEKTGISILSYISTFVVLAILWLFIFQIFRNIGFVDRNFAYIDFVFLMVLVFVPFSSEISIRYIEAAGNLFLMINLLLLGILCLGLFLYATGKKSLVNPGLTPARHAYLMRQFLVIPGFAIVGLGLTFAGFPEGDTLFLLAIPVLLVFFRE